MRVFIAGASGVLGRRLVALLAARGHEVRGLARTAAAEATVRQAGGAPATADLFDADSLARAADGCEVMVHAATAIPRRKAPSAADFSLNDRIRREGTRALLDAASRTGARRFLFQSIVWAARPDDGAPFDESTPPPRTDPIALSALDGEEMVAAAGFSTLRCGWFYGSDAGTREMAASLRQGTLPLIDGGKVRLSFLHLDDAASAFAIAAERAGTGLWHVVDDEPAPLGDFVRELARLIGAAAPPVVPAGDAPRFTSIPMVTSAAQFNRDFSWLPQYPTFREGLAQTVREWELKPS